MVLERINPNCFEVFDLSLGRFNQDIKFPKFHINFDIPPDAPVTFKVPDSYNLSSSG